jgi:NADH-quinone oxidoreductase subunit N
MQATNLVTFFVALETLSIPLYILCAANMRREGSLESGLKYLIVGSIGSATLLYGMAFLYGGSGSTGFAGIAAGIAHNGLDGDPLILIGIAMAAVGLAFKTSIAPFHQWTPDVYQGAPTAPTGRSCRWSTTASSSPRTSSSSPCWSSAVAAKTCAGWAGWRCGRRCWRRCS